MSGELRNKQDRALHLFENNLVYPGQVGSGKRHQPVKRRCLLQVSLVVQSDDICHGNTPLSLLSLGRAASIEQPVEASSRDPRNPINGEFMKELLRTNDPVLISWLQALLRDDGIESFVFDAYMSILEGSAGAIPRRLIVIDEDLEIARKIVTDAGEGDQLGSV
jgi:hypothetical protein